MAWQKLTGLTGKVYIPEYRGQAKRHPCPDCFDCQNCSEERCLVCRSRKTDTPDKTRRCPNALLQP